MNKFSVKSIWLISLLSIVATAHAWAATWDELSSGNHSFRDLGPAFSVEVPMVPATNAHIVLFDHKLADRLNLNVPKDPEKLEKLLLKNFAWQVDQAAKSKITRFATYYQDSPNKGPGDALGDGRLVWLGEIQVKRPDGSIEYLDVTAKGVGVTPLAWTNHENVLHKDGYLGEAEAIHSFVISEANLKNGLDSTAEICVIELDKYRKSKGGGKERAAISIRVGKQTRLAHLRYHQDNPENFKKIFDYIVKRDLGLPLDSRMTKGRVKQYLQLFTENLADEAARYYDLFAVHGSPTPGNRTTLGGTIDLGTFRYLDAHHSDYSYLFERLKLGGDFGQTQQLKSYVDGLFEYLETAKYPLTPNDFDLTEASRIFDETYESTLKKLWLARLGLNQKEISELPGSVSTRLFSAVTALYEAQSKEVFQPSVASKPIHFAKYDVRKSLSTTMSVFSQPQLTRKEQAEKIFSSKRIWVSKSVGKLNSLEREYLNAVNDVIHSATKDGLVRSAWIENAEDLTRAQRAEPGAAFFYGPEKYSSSQQVTQSIARKHSFEENSKAANQAIEDLSDHDLPSDRFFSSAIFVPADECSKYFRNPKDR